MKRYIYIVVMIVAILQFGGCGEKKEENKQVQTDESANKIDNSTIDDVTVKDEEVVKPVSQMEENEITQENIPKVEVADEKTKKTEPAEELSGEMLYGKCQGCHGAKGEKVALGKSKIINKMSAKEFEDAILGYQKQTYGGAMKELMQGQVLNMKPNEIKAIAAYITKK